MWSAAPARPRELLADVDAMFLAEYNYYQINEAMRSLAKTVSNIAVSNVAQNQLGLAGGLLGMAYSIATTNAEIRTWVTLPQRITLQRIQKNKSGLIKLGNGDTINVEFEGNHIIQVRGSDVKTVRIR